MQLKKPQLLEIPQPTLIMPKFELKKGTDPKGVVSYRVPKMKDGDKTKSGMARVVFGQATQAQLAHLAKLKHPFVEEVKAGK